MRKIIVSVAPVSLNVADTVKSALTPAEIASDVIKSANCGASMVHLHVRDEMGNLTDNMTNFSKTLDLIKEKSDIIVQGSTGGISDLTLDQRCVSITDKRVEVASLNMGSANLEDDVYVNTLPDIRYWLKRMNEERVKPELEVFEAGMVNNVFLMNQENLLNKLYNFAFCLGFKGAMPASAYNLHFLKEMVPAGSTWGFIHHGMMDMSLLATAIGMGATMIRVGFEDSVYYAEDKMAKSNQELVGQAVSLIRSIGYEVATPAEARKILNITD